MKKRYFGSQASSMAHGACQALVVLLNVISVVATFSGTQFDAFDVREATIEKVHDALLQGFTSCRSIVEAFIARIETYNPQLNAIISLNPHALLAADDIDLALNQNNITGSLLCVPILVKDNYDTQELPTSGGCLALANLKPTQDAPAIRALKAAGAIILGKTNMHELALEGLSVSSLGGQTVNPYGLTRTPGGSSGGTGAAIAASFAVLGTGTDTVNSLRSPASANSLFSIRPTRGLISRSGIIPISHTQDVAGPIARNVEDLAVALTVMASAGYDENDNATMEVPPEVRLEDDAATFRSESLHSKRFGLIEPFFNRTESAETTPVNEAIATTVSALNARGASVVSIDSSIFNSTRIFALCDTQRFEYRQNLDVYLSKPSTSGDFPATFEQLYASGDFLVIPKQYEYIKTARLSSTSNTSYTDVKHCIQALTEALEGTFQEYHLDALIYPEQSNLVVKIGTPSQHGRNGILAAVTGYPVVTVPAGFSPPSPEASLGVPIGIEILGLKWSEGTLLSIAKQIAEARPVRRGPKFCGEAVESLPLSEVPRIVPDTKAVSSVYPIGVL